MAKRLWRCDGTRFWQKVPVAGLGKVFMHYAH